MGHFASQSLTTITVGSPRQENMTRLSCKSNQPIRVPWPQAGRKWRLLEVEEVKNEQHGGEYSREGGIREYPQ
jgi:hypothetical protein